ncbi:hypothetical protein PG993_003558 [Apiospora rasikravindrae]|uniref:Uncharacterized protein n=1 Tax=Apiospora rasikravindrae TaxID=990691 RepID=A0ABR1U2K4_9PEZI
MPTTPEISRPNKSFNWDTNEVSPNGDDIPYLDRKDAILDVPLLDPLDEFLAIPVHSPARLRLPRLFHPLCSNKSIREHRSGTSLPLNRNVPRSKELTRKQRLGHETLPDARIRRMHIPDPSRHTVSSLICRAPWNQRLVLRDFIKRYIKADGLMSVRILSTGSNCEDFRKTKDGKPLRKLQDMSFLSRSVESGTSNGKVISVEYLYEAQSSCVVTGYNNTYWTALSFSDTYFYPGANNDDESDCGGNEDMLPDYDGDDDGDFTDPLTIGNTTIPHKRLDPRHYFLVVLSARLDKVKDEWDHIRDELSSRVSDYLSNPHITSPSATVTLASTGGHAEAVKKSYEWVTAVMYLLEKLLVTLDKVIKAFGKFEKSGLVKCTGPEPSQLLQLPLQEIRQSVDELGIIRHNLSTLRQEAQVFKEQVMGMAIR